MLLLQYSSTPINIMWILIGIIACAFLALFIGSFCYVMTLVSKAAKAARAQFLTDFLHQLDETTDDNFKFSKLVDSKAACTLYNLSKENDAPRFQIDFSIATLLLGSRCHRYHTATTPSKTYDIEYRFIPDADGLFIEATALIAD